LIERKKNNFVEQKAVLCALIHGGQTAVLVDEYLEELAFLAETAGAITKKIFIQKLPKPESSTFLGKGKLEEIWAYCKGHQIDIVIFDDELSGAQIGNISEALGGVRVIDRSDLILDIFAARAKTSQAKTQVELAQYKYILPRLRGMWKHLERQGAGIGSRGPGETEIETDRRIIREKITLLGKKLKDIDKQATTQRQERGEFIRVALVGYTNVGKSTIMNLLSKSELLAENKLFATLDTTTRKLVLDRTPFLISDTVGFIRKLPHHLVESFKSTLDEVREADLLVHVVDLNHAQYEEQMAVVDATLLDLKCEEKAKLVVFNKVDLFEKNYFDEWLAPEVKEELRSELHKRWNNNTQGNSIFISATERENIENFRTALLDRIRQLYGIRYPYKTIFYE
jgi:GTPase